MTARHPLTLSLGALLIVLSARADSAPLRATVDRHDVRVPHPVAQSPAQRNAAATRLAQAADRSEGDPGWSEGGDWTTDRIDPSDAAIETRAAEEAAKAANLPAGELAAKKAETARQAAEARAVHAAATFHRAAQAAYERIPRRARLPLARMLAPLLPASRRRARDPSRPRRGRTWRAVCRQRARPARRAGR